MKEIKLENWERREHYAFFSAVAQPSYSICFPVDVTAYHEFVKKEGISFYYGLVYLSTLVQNELEAFRYRIRGEKVFLHEQLLPSFTDLKPHSELFHITSLEMQGLSISEFSQKAKQTSQEQSAYFPTDYADRDDLVYYSCVPWISFTGLTNEMDNDPDDSIPRIAWGKYYWQEGKLLLPYSMQVNHRLLDGIALGQFAERLQQLLDQIGR